MTSPLRSLHARALGALTTIALLSVITGCGPALPTPTRDGILGSWEAHEGDHTVRIELHGDGMVQIEDVPRAVLERETDELDWDDTVDLSGEWTFSEATDEPYSEALISVTLDEASGSQWLSLYPRGGGLHLYYGDVENSSHLFFNLTRAAPTAGPETISRTDLVGEWGSSSSGMLTLRGDGTFEIEGAPAVFVTYVDDAGEETPITPSGQWHFTESTLPLDPVKSSVMLSFEGMYGPLQSFVTKSVELQESDGALSLSFHDEVRWEKD